MTSQAHDRAIVLGGSIAGLLAARALADHYSEVLVVDRDVLDAGAGPRRGNPQARHTHALLARGREVLEELFDGLTRELTSAGAPLGDMLADTRLCFGGHRLAPGPSGLQMVSVSRDFLEGAVRRRVAELPAVTIRGGHDVVGLRVDRSARRVIGARVFDRRDGSAEEELPADLVVDACGRGSRVPLWLEQFGFPRPRAERLRVAVGYVSRRYAADRPLDDALVALSAPTPACPRGGALSKLEDGSWLLTLTGMLGAYPPTDPERLIEFAAGLELPDLHEALLAAEPLDDPVAHRHPTSVRYDFGGPLPSGLLVVGDAACCLNPIYGQGMTVAALQAARLRRDPDSALRDLLRPARAAWALASGADLAFAGVPGKRTVATRALGRYVARVQQRAAVDPAVGAAFLRVTSMIDPPSAMMRPALLRAAAGSPRRARPRAIAQGVPATGRPRRR